MPCIIFTINNEICMMMIKERSTRREKNNEVKLNTFLITKPWSFKYYYLCSLCLPKKYFWIYYYILNAQTFGNEVVFSNDSFIMVFYLHNEGKYFSFLIISSTSSWSLSHKLNVIMFWYKRYINSFRLMETTKISQITVFRFLFYFYVYCLP